MFSVITNIYNKKTKRPALMELFTATGKVKFFLTTRDAIVRAIRHESLQQWRISMHPFWRVCGKNLNIVSMCAVSPAVHTSNISSC
jgi:hypothetical protein